MDRTKSLEEARDAQIAALTKKSVVLTKALLAAGDLATVRVVGNSVTDYLAFAHDDLHDLVLGKVTFESVRDKVIEAGAEVEAIQEVERMEGRRQASADEARVDHAIWHREIA